MPSVDHCMNKPTEMTTITNSLEVFDTYKHREDKDSDEESFHLPLDDDESEPKFQESVKNTNNGPETEDEILNKFDSTAAALDAIDSQLEDHLLNDEEEEKRNKTNKNGGNEISDLKCNSAQVSPAASDDFLESNSEDNQIIHSSDKSKDTVSIKKEYGPSVDCTTETKECSTSIAVNNVGGSDAVLQSSALVEKEAMRIDDVPKVDVVSNLSYAIEESSAIGTLNQNKDDQLDIDKLEDKSKSDEVGNKPNEELPSETNDPLKTSENKIFTNENELKDSRTALKTEGDKPTDKCENSNENSNQNDDSEDLFDISIIRDAAEDNAESAYNEAHPEESHIEENEDYDDRNEDKGEDDCSSSDKANNLEEEEELEDIDIDKHDDQLKNDDVEIEETNLKLDDGIKETISDSESDNSNKTDSVQIKKDKVQDTSEISSSAKESVTECRLDEVTGNLIGGDTVQANSSEKVNHNSEEKPMDVDTDGSEKRKSLKRTISEDSETGTAKKSRTEQVVDVEIKEVEKPKEILPLRTLLSLSDFMKTKKTNKRLTMHDLEEFCLQKICEVIVHKSDLGDVHHQLKLQEQLIETMRKEIQQLTKQARDLEIVNKKLMNDLKQQNATQKPLNPLKITRSVGLQVKFTPAFEANMKRRQPNAAIGSQKVQVQTTTNRGPRNIPNAPTSGLNRQVNSPQKQQQPLPKPNTPLLSQALLNRRAATNDGNIKTTPQPLRPKASDSKTVTPSASVIDLTDEDDKKDKNKNTPTKMVAQKNITVPLRTTPMRVNTTQGIRLTTSQGKVSPITSVVTSSAPQVMYVVQSSPQNVLTSTLGSKAVVVNFQSANGVITSALNGSQVSVIPKQSNTIQLKTVTPSKALPNNKVIKMTNKHPAPLPPPPVIRVSLDKPLKPIPPKPHLTIRKTDTGIILQWKMPYDLDMYEVIASYQLYAYQETSALPSTDMWRKVGDVKALALPMACTLTQFADKNKYYFAVRPVDIHKRIGVFSEPEEISL